MSFLSFCIKIGGASTVWLGGMSERPEKRVASVRQTTIELINAFFEIWMGSKTCEMPGNH
jgi:hypothetical protein